MKEVIKRDAIVPYRELKKRSPVPVLTAGVVFLLCGLTKPLYRAGEYAAAVIAALLAFYAARIFFRNRVVRIDLPPNTGVAQADQLLSEAREALAFFRAANDRIQDEKVSAAIDGIEAAGVKILNRLEEEPALHGQLRTFLRYYLPTTRKLLDARAAIEAGGAATENAKIVCARCDRVLPEIRRAFEKQLDALDKNKYLDLQVEMDVLEGMLKSNT
ncbi:MAG: 5-bromo-4-chloroindolyl phosphate hydrolysis family protein [Firmicutes bacterium]|nr:5-bromo-4-chloroindolyl phosphate hydrolysis family protein [Bacillota bacterium]